MDPIYKPNYKKSIEECDMHRSNHKNASTNRDSIGYKLVLLGGLVASTTAIAEPVPEIDCLIEPNMIIELSSPVSGVLDTISVDRSDAVKKGQVVATLKSDVEQVELRASKETLKLSRVEQKRARDLYRQNALTLSEKEQSDHEVALSELEVESALANLELRKIRSPIDGVVADRYLMPGEFIEDNPILKLAQLDPLRVEVVAPVTYFGRVTTGMHAQVKTEFGSFDDLVAEVVVVDKVVDAASGTFGIRLELENQDYLIPGGLKCSVRFFDEAEEAAYMNRDAEPGDLPIETEAVTSDTELIDEQPGPICRRIGPFKDRGDLLALMAALENEISGYEVRDEPGTSRSYRVATPTLESYSGAKELNAALKQAGVKDIAVIKKDGRYSVSLGVFRSEQSANRRQAAIEKLGFDCAVVPQQTSKSTYWAEVIATTTDDELSGLVAAAGIEGTDNLLYQACSTEILAAGDVFKE